MMMAERLPTIAFILCRVLPCDAVAWVSMNHLAPVVGMTVWPADASTPPYARQVAASRVAGLLDRPGEVRSRGPGDMRPAGQRSRDPAGLPLEACHLLGMPVGDEPVEGWILARSAEAFTARDLDIADLLVQGVRAATAAGASTRLPDTRPAAETPTLTVPVAEMPSLTARERQMLELVGTGLTASAIGRRTGISVRTVHKHLQNAYAKLGCGDRLSAVLTIQALEPGSVRFPAHPAST